MTAARAGSLAIALAAALAAPARAPGRAAPVVALVPVGPVDARLLQVARGAVESRFAVQVRVEAARELPRSAWYAPRKRWRAEKILEALEADPPSGAWKVVAVTAAEISTAKDAVEDWRVAGLGSMGGAGCVVSLWINERHSRTRAILERRTADLVIHELGHTLGLEHCESPGCVMRDAKGRYLESMDSSSGELCERCRGRVGEGVLRR